GDARDDVTALRDTLDSLRTQLATVTTFATGWGGVTPAALLERLAAGEVLRTRLTALDGSLLDAAAFGRRPARLSTTLVTEGELTEAIGNLRLQLPDDQRAALLEQARTAAQRQSEQTTAALGDQLRDLIATRLAAAEAAAASSVTALAGQLRDSLR